MKTTIYCKVTDKGIHSFYLVQGGSEYFLFHQSFRRGVKEYFGYGVPINEAFNFSGTRGNTALIHTMEKLPAYIKYIEKEYGVEVLRQTAKKNKSRKKPLAA